MLNWIKSQVVGRGSLKWSPSEIKGKGKIVKDLPFQATSGKAKHYSLGSKVWIRFQYFCVCNFLCHIASFPTPHFLMMISSETLKEIRPSGFVFTKSREAWKAVFPVTTIIYGIDGSSA
jgi:hypothetical protein